MWIKLNAANGGLHQKIISEEQQKVGNWANIIIIIITRSWTQNNKGGVEMLA